MTIVHTFKCIKMCFQFFHLPQQCNKWFNCFESVLKVKNKTIFQAQSLWKKTQKDPNSSYLIWFWIQLSTQIEEVLSIFNLRFQHTSQSGHCNSTVSIYLFISWILCISADIHVVVLLDFYSFETSWIIARYFFVHGVIAFIESMLMLALVL